VLSPDNQDAIKAGREESGNKKGAEPAAPSENVNLIGVRWQQLPERVARATIARTHVTVTRDGPGDDA
jgi:hypothetical protein